MASFKICLLVICINFFSLNLFGQDSLVSVYPTFISGAYTDKRWDLKQNNPFIILDLPIIKNKFYSEIRYNYDQLNTLGIYAGKIFSLSKKTAQVLIPQIGFLYGNYKGASLQFYYQFINKRVEINFQNQHGISFNKLSNFYFNWSDIQFPITKKIKVGGSVQIYSAKELNTSDFALLVTYKSGNWIVALYSFDFYDLPKHFFAFGIQKAFSFKLRNNSLNRTTNR